MHHILNIFYLMLYTINSAAVMEWSCEQGYGMLLYKNRVQLNVAKQLRNSKSLLEGFKGTMKVRWTKFLALDV